MATEIAGLGHYWRDREGVWRYTISGLPVPGARPRRLFDAEHDYPRLTIEGVRYVSVPRWRLDACPELVPICAADGVLAEEHGAAELFRLLVPEAAWPTAEDPAGGMWAPELAPDQLLDARALAKLMGYASVDVVWVRLAEGILPGPVVRLHTQRGRPAGLPRRAITTWWTRPVLEQWRERYREAHPQRCDMAARRAKMDARALERLRVLREAGRAPRDGRRRKRA